MLKQGVKLQKIKKMYENFPKIIIFAVYNFIPSFRLERSGMEKSHSYFTGDFSTPFGRSK